MKKLASCIVFTTLALSLTACQSLKTLTHQETNSDQVATASAPKSKMGLKEQCSELKRQMIANDNSNSQETNWTATTGREKVRAQYNELGCDS